MAAVGLTSYRYKGRYGWVMIGARDDAEALREAARSVGGGIDRANLDVWDGSKYVPAPSRRTMHRNPIESSRIEASGGSDYYAEVSTRPDRNKMYRWQAFFGGTPVGGASGGSYSLIDAQEAAAKTLQQLTKRRPMRKSTYRNGPNLYDDLVGAGIPLDHHESDLYVLHTPMAVSIIRQHGQLGTPFIGTDGKRWLDIPFAYMPFWRSREGKAKKAKMFPRKNPCRNPPMLVVAMFHPTTLAGVQRTVPALDAAEAVHKLFDKFPPRPGHHIEVRRDGRLIGQWFVSKGAHANPMRGAKHYLTVSGYIEGIRNAKKRDYARAYLNWKRRGEPVDFEPDRPEGLSYMAAQAVRHNVDAILGKELWGFNNPRKNPITFHGAYKTGTWYVTGEMPRHTGERARGRQMPVYRVSSKADGLALAKRLRAGGARRVDVYSPSGGGSYHLDRDGRLVES
jgi:hypothetical protein